ncbi:enoyl-CoA hydratase/isomerase family protein [Variovorax sp. Sphag1AA]|uniref:enoyl-CoA hydratase/isomerase family protein n=1 Tax=Variovorax sp. Sphag1AA TaxID=2587027 RepID=UPI0016161F0F|nr:enoyl-CoA hydratase/isomerase family protein [Variovorax sp. Sphag1AA]MBB3181612.1 enoyl-CoA hydratase/carnithine racemase [Variovorax sp. Sphag1AA]
MTHITTSDHVLVIRHGAVAQLEMRLRPPGYIDESIVRALADSLEALDADDSCRAVVLCAQGKVFCAGADLSSAGAGQPPDVRSFYGQVMRLYRTRKPIVAAVDGPAIGAGMGLTLMADFRVGGPAARFCANFNRLGLHPGFGMSVTLPRVVGDQQATLLFYTGRRFDGEAAMRIGLLDEFVPDDQVLSRALELAGEIAASAPLAVESTRETMRLGLADRIHEINQRELREQHKQLPTADFREGVAAMAERRMPVFHRR